MPKPQLIAACCKEPLELVPLAESAVVATKGKTGRTQCRPLETPERVFLRDAVKNHKKEFAGFIDQDGTICFKTFAEAKSQCPFDKTVSFHTHPEGKGSRMKTKETERAVVQSTILEFRDVPSPSDMAYFLSCPTLITHIISTPKGFVEITKKPDFQPLAGTILRSILNNAFNNIAAPYGKHTLTPLEKEQKTSVEWLQWLNSHYAVTIQRKKLNEEIELCYG